MNRIGAVILTLCAALATPVLGYWEYDGTTVTTDGPGSGSDPYGTWAWYAYANGSVYPSMDLLTATGSAYGGAWCMLGTWNELGLQRSVYGTSRVEGTSSYHWVEDETSKEITVDAEVTIYSSEITCWGDLVDWGGTDPTCYSDGLMTGGGNGSSGFTFYPYGYTYLTGNNSGNNTTFESDNSWFGVEATTDEFGHLVIRGTANQTYNNVTPPGQYYSVTAMVFGQADARGRITITGQPYAGGFYAEAHYSISADSILSLSGNIDDLE